MKKALIWFFENMFIVFGVVLLLLSSFMITIEVFYRYILNSPHDWSDNIILLLCMFTVFLASGACVKEKAHIAVTTLYVLTKGKLRKALDWVNYVIEFIFCAVFFWFGIEYVLFLMKIDMRESTSLETPMWIALTAIPIGMTISMYYLIRIIISIVRRKTNDSVVDPPKITM